MPAPDEMYDHFVRDSKEQVLLIPCGNGYFVTVTKDNCTAKRMSLAVYDSYCIDATAKVVAVDETFELSDRRVIEDIQKDDVLRICVLVEKFEVR